MHVFRFRFRLLLALALLAPLTAMPASEIKPWPRGAPAPVLALTDLDGREWRLKDLRGKVVVLNFWATWCEPCRAEMPSLVQLVQRHPRERLVVLAANYQEGEAKIRRYLESVEVPSPVLMDRDGAAAKAWTRRIFPTSVVIDAEGRPRYTITGEYDWSSQDADRLLSPLISPARRP